MCPNRGLAALGGGESSTYRITRLGGELDLEPMTLPGQGAQGGERRASAREAGHAANRNVRRSDAVARSATGL